MDVAHEALIRHWQQLRLWLDENRDALRKQRKIEEDAKYWIEKDKSSEFLWGGSRLAEAEEVLSEYAATVSLSQLAQDFLEASRQQELRSYLQLPAFDNLDQKGLEEEAATKSFLTRERLKQLLADEREEPQIRLVAAWGLKQWGEKVPIQMAEVDGQGKISLRVMEEKKLPPTVVEDLGNGISLELVKIPGGEFLMGATEGEEGANWWELPQHKVKVSPFLMGKYPVTQSQWRAIASLDKVERDLNPDPSYFKGDGRPVECVSWYEAVEFCRRLSRKTRREYRLPSEAEWEYACRSVSSEQSSVISRGNPPVVAPIQNPTYPPFHFGEKISPALANYQETRRGETTPVGRFQVANSFGLYDMHGNVWEWCEDDWHNTYDGAPTDGSAWLSSNRNITKVLRDWLSSNRNTTKVVRGGSWGINPKLCRSAYRYNYNPRDYRNYTVGFRVVRAVPRTP